MAYSLVCTLHCEHYTESAAKTNTGKDNSWAHAIRKENLCEGTGQHTENGI